MASKTTKPPRKKTGTSVARVSVEQRKTLFVEAFIQNGGNATQAAIRAGYSKIAAHNQGSQMLKRPDVAAAIKARSDKLAKQYSLTTDDVIRSISQEMHFDPARLFNDDGSLKKVTELDLDTRMALTSIECEQILGKDGKSRVTVSKYKWGAKHQAREQAMKHLGMFEADNLQKGPLSDIPRELLRAMVERLRQMNGSAR
jgi:phage terminase small subunit